MFKYLFLFFLSYQIFANDTYCVAHRANGFNELENSLGAIKEASLNRVKGIEIDIHHTKDGVSLVYHDEKLERLVIGSQCPVGKKIKDLLYADILKNCKLQNGELIPTLKEALMEISLGNSKLFIEIKDNKITSQDYLDIKSLFHERVSQISFISFDSRVLRKIRDYRQKDPYFMMTKLIRLNSTGNNINIRYYDGVDAKKISRRKVREYQKQNKIVGVYTKNKKKDILSEFNKGVDFITTDNYKVCKKLLNY